MAELAPAAIAVERVLFQVNARTAISVGQASGLALAVAARAGMPVVQYSPNEVKLAVTGDGAADKLAVQTMVTRLLDLPRRPQAPRRGRRARAGVVPFVARAFDRGADARSRPRRRHGFVRDRQGDAEGSTMIGSIRGTVLERTTSGEVLVEVGGVGYRVLGAGRRARHARRRVTPRSSSRTSTCARTRWCSSGSRRATNATRSRR